MGLSTWLYEKTGGLWFYMFSYWVDSRMNRLLEISGMERPMEWMMNTIDLLAERKKHEQFFLELYEE